MIENADTSGAPVARRFRLVGRVSKEFLLGGHATFVLRRLSGERRYVVMRPGRWWTGHPEARFVYALPGRRYLGMLDSSGSFRITGKSEFGWRTPIVANLRSVIQHLWKGAPLPVGWSIETTGRCGCCNMSLRTEESLEAGFGPVCLRKRNEKASRAA